MEGGKSSKLRS